MKLGLQLSDKGATPKMEKGVIWTKPIPICYSEKDIFDFLGLAYKTPVQRDIWFDFYRLACYNLSKKNQRIIMFRISFHYI